MKKLMLLFFATIIILNIGKTQTKYDIYESLYSKADSFYKVGIYENAMINYFNAVQYIEDKSGTPYFKAADCALKLKNFKLADKFIRDGISIGGANMEYLKNFEEFKDYEDRSFFISILIDYKNLRNKYISSIENIDLYLEIEYLINRDQFARNVFLYLEGYEEDSILSPEIDKRISEKYGNSNWCWDLMHKVDSMNIDRLIKICKIHGWQSRAWLILWHQRGTYGENNYIWNFFTPLINNAIEEGKESRDFWIEFENFKRWLNNEKSSGIIKKE